MGRTGRGQGLRAAAAALLLLAALMAGPPAARADFAAGFAAFQAGRYPQALKELRPAAEAGDKRAQYLLGRMYRDGLGVKRNTETAVTWLRRAADGPDADRYALHDLAVLYERGRGVKRDLKRAVALYRRAAERGVAAAMLNLGVLLARGQGVERDLAEGLRLVYRAYEAGEPQAARAFDTLARAADPDPPVAGRWRAVAYAGPADDPNERDPAGVARLALGTELRLGRSAFALGRRTCAEPVFLADALAPGALLADAVGATRALGLAPDLGASGPVRTVEVVCGRDLAASLALLAEGRVLLPAFGGYLVMEPSPSPRVEEVQRRLAALGYDPGPADGIFGARTAGAIAAFQAAAGLPATGALDPALIARLRRGPAP